jgi:hypothetical protein
VPVPPGSWRFDLVYQPASVRWGLWMSGGTLLLLAAAVLWHWRGRRNQRLAAEGQARP